MPGDAKQATVNRLMSALDTPGSSVDSLGELAWAASRAGQWRVCLAAWEALLRQPWQGGVAIRLRINRARAAYMAAQEAFQLGQLDEARRLLAVYGESYRGDGRVNELITAVCRLHALQLAMQELARARGCAAAGGWDDAARRLGLVRDTLRQSKHMPPDGV